MSGPQSMLAATLHARRDICSIERDCLGRAIESDEILLRVRAASICGTDVKIIPQRPPQAPDGQRIVLGHEFVGAIEHVGRAWRAIASGSGSGCAPNAGCGQCDACIRGQANYCPDYTAFGIDRDGGHAAFDASPGRFIAQGNVDRRCPTRSPTGGRAAGAVLLRGQRRAGRADRIGRHGGHLRRRADRADAPDALSCGRRRPVDRDRSPRGSARSGHTLGCDVAINPHRDDVAAHGCGTRRPARRGCRDHGLPGGRRSSRRPSAAGSLRPAVSVRRIAAGQRHRAAGHQRHPLRQLSSSPARRADRCRTIASPCGWWPASGSTLTRRHLPRRSRLPTCGPAYDAALAGAAGKVVLVAE